MNNPYNEKVFFKVEKKLSRVYAELPKNSFDDFVIWEQKLLIERVYSRT